MYLGTFNICNGRVFGLVQGIRAVQIGGFDLMILTETNITERDYCCNILGYNVVYLQIIMFVPWKRVDSKLHPWGWLCTTSPTPPCDLLDSIMIICKYTTLYPRMLQQ